MRAQLLTNEIAETSADTAGPAPDQLLPKKTLRRNGLMSGSMRWISLLLGSAAYVVARYRDRKALIGHRLCVDHSFSAEDRLAEARSPRKHVARPAYDSRDKFN